MRVAQVQTLGAASTLYRVLDTPCFNERIAQAQPKCIQVWYLIFRTRMASSIGIYTDTKHHQLQWIRPQYASVSSLATTARETHSSSRKILIHTPKERATQSALHQQGVEASTPDRKPQPHPPGVIRFHTIPSILHHPSHQELPTPVDFSSNTQPRH